MCEYCKNVVTGDDYKTIVNDETNEKISSDVSVGIVYKDPFPVLEVDVKLMDKLILSNNTSITFCPMCGCNLRKASEEHSKSLFSAYKNYKGEF